MIDEIKSAFTETLQMFEDGIRKMPDNSWRRGTGDFLIPARIAYHIMIGLEWFVTSLPEDEHRRTRRYNLNWKGPVKDMPDRQVMLNDLAWMKGRIFDWFSNWERESSDSKDRPSTIGKALYFLRHTQHHIGEYSATARLLDVERPTWIYPTSVPSSIRNKA
jgi:hypothetical protein